MDARNLLFLLGTKKIVIYGTGYVAQKFFSILKKNSLVGNIICFAVSKGEKEGESIDGIAVKNIRDIESDNMVCIAVHEALKDEMVDTLCDIGINNYIWIYPYLYQLLLGEPIEKGVRIKLEDIVQTCLNDYRIAVRYAAIDNYYGKNIYGFDLYRRAQALYSSMKTAEERLERFCKLISDWQKYGYDEDSWICINEGYEIIDGAHRVTLAKYHGMQEIICNVFEGKASAYEVHGERVVLTNKILLQNGFSIEEIDKLNEINNVIRFGK